jgi:hypothetical protein
MRRVRRKVIARKRYRPEDIIANLRKVDLLIPGAGGNEPPGTTDQEFLTPQEHQENTQGFFDLDLADFYHVFNLNFLSMLLTIKTFSK